MKLEGRGWLGIVGPVLLYTRGRLLSNNSVSLLPIVAAVPHISVQVSSFGVDARVHGTLVLDPKCPLVS